MDYPDEDGLIESLPESAEQLCGDIARLSGAEREALSEPARETLRVAVLYTVANLFEHREDADHHALTLTLRSLLFGIRKGEFRMNIGKLGERVEIQQQQTVTDEIGNHRNVWTDFYHCSVFVTTAVERVTRSPRKPPQPWNTPISSLPSGRVKSPGR